MKELMKVVIVSPESEVFQGQVKSLSIKGVDGELGIHPGHLQLLTQIAPGPVRMVTEGDEVELMYVAGGFLEVQPNQVSILADVIERPQDVNESAALEAKEKAEKLLASKASDIDTQKTHQDLQQALARLRVLELTRKNKKRH